MSLLTVDRYRAITGDSDTEATTVTALAEEAVDLLEDELGRPLESAERTEVVWLDRSGWAYPLATPITVATGWTIEGEALRGGTAALSGYPFRDPPDKTRTTSITYTGGFAERSADPAAANALPACIERDLAWAVYALSRPDATLSTIPAGATSVRLGDISVTWPQGARPTSVQDLTIRWSRATLRHRRRGL